MRSKVFRVGFGILILLMPRPRGGDFVFDMPGWPSHWLGMTGKGYLPDVFSQHPQVMSGALVFKGTRVPA
jgi:hypothetical protein